ncbi:MAG: hypothetical protein K8W52_31420 [Deltaproteobacteria bacterium]|nr:hypothetical protein [Deltaproteobacteria bacterium]
MSDATTELEAALTDDDRAFLDELADAISKRRLASAALFFLESLEPLNFLGASMMVFLRPIVGMVWNDPLRWDRVQRLLEHRGAIGLLLRRLEARA